MASGPDTVDYNVVEARPTSAITVPLASDEFVIRRAGSETEYRLPFDELADAVGVLPADVYDGAGPSDAITITLDGGAPGDAITETVDGGSPLGVVKIAAQMMRRGTSGDWAAAGDPVLPIAMFGALLSGGVVSGIKVGDDASPWSSLGWFIEEPWLSAYKTKLDGIATGAQVNPAQVSSGEKTAGAETAIRSFSPKDVADMAADFGGGGGGSTPDQVSSPERDASTLLDLRSYSPADVRYIAERFAKIVATVHGRTGAVVGASGDYTTDQITETATRFFLSDLQKAKLDALPADGGVVDVPSSITLSVAAHRTKSLNVTAGSVTITVPPLSGGSAFTAHDVIPIFAPNSVVTVAAGSGVTIARAGATGTSHQIQANSDAYLRKRPANNTWVLVGALV